MKETNKKITIVIDGHGMITNALLCVNNERLCRMRAVFVTRGDELLLQNQPARDFAQIEQTNLHLPPKLDVTIHGLSLI